MLINNITETIGNTPLLKANNFAEINGVKCSIYLKLEYLNPAGSIKDRVAYYMLKEALDKNLIDNSSVIIEPTSGNTGIGLAMASSALGLKLILTMPENMSIERRKILKAYGAEIVLTDKDKGMKGAIDKAEELNGEINNSYICGQFTNFINPLCHKLTTAEEIWNDLNGNIDYVVSAIGTGGTISGIGELLKSKNKGIHIIAVEPDKSPVLSEGKSGSHKIQGIGAGFVPKILNRDVIDEVLTVSFEDSVKCAKALVRSEGVLCGISSGAALSAAVDFDKSHDIAGKNMVIILPDGGDRYFSTELFED